MTTKESVHLFNFSHTQIYWIWQPEGWINIKHNKNKNYIVILCELREQQLCASGCQSCYVWILKKNMRYINWFCQIIKYAIDGQNSECQNGSVNMSHTLFNRPIFLEFLHVMMVAKCKLLGIVEAVLYTCRMLFLSANQEHQHWRTKRTHKGRQTELHMNHTIIICLSNLKLVTGHTTTVPPMTFIHVD